MYAAAHALQRFYGPLLKPLGLTYVQYLVLLVLWEADDRTVGQIGRRLYLDSGTLTPVLRRLERLGVVSRSRAVDDEREVRIRLTPAGVRLERELAAVRSAIACRGALEPAVFAKLRDELQALRARFATDS